MIWARAEVLELIEEAHRRMAGQPRALCECPRPVLVARLNYETDFYRCEQCNRGVSMIDVMEGEAFLASQ